MAVMAIYRRDKSPNLYDQLRTKLPVDPVPVGALAHFYGLQGDEVVVVDVWEDEAAMRTFISKQLKPVLDGLDPPFQMPEIITLKSIITTSATGPYERPFAAASAPV